MRTKKMNVSLVKRLRMSLGLTQMDFAQKLGVSFATINRWENGHNYPSGLAREKLLSMERELLKNPA